MPTVYVEGYGCSLNLGDTDAIKGFLSKHGFELLSNPEKANFIIINTCAVKDKTEHDMISRIRKLNEFSQKNNSELIVMGCLPKMNSTLMASFADPKIISLGTKLSELAHHLNIPVEEFSPATPALRRNPLVDIMVIERGCLNVCTFCGTKGARGHLSSYPINQLNERFEKSLALGVREFWLTGQDTGCYGFDLNSNLPELLKKLLSHSGDFRIRLGMMNPHHAGKIADDLLPLFRDERLYKFLHIPLQAGSNKVLREMKREYTKEDYLSLVQKIRSRVSEMHFSTDVIAGFPGESEAEFQETMDVLHSTTPLTMNISAYSKRPNTLAAKMKNQIPGRIAKSRTRRLSTLREKLFEDYAIQLIGKKEKILVSESGSKGNFIGRTGNYIPVLVPRGLGEFHEVEIQTMHRLYLEGRLLGQKLENPLKLKILQ